MGIFDFIAERRVVLPLRMATADFSRCQVACAEAIKSVRKRLSKESERCETQVKESPSDSSSSLRYKSGSARVDLAEALKHAETFARHLMRLVESKCGGRAAVCYKRAGLSRQVYSYVVNNPGNRPNRETVLRLAIGLQLSYEETVDFLSSAGYAFCPTDERDIVFAACIKHGVYNIFDVNDTLVSVGLAPFKID